MDLFSQYVRAMHLCRRVAVVFTDDRAIQCVLGERGDTEPETTTAATTTTPSGGGGPLHSGTGATMDGKPSWFRTKTDL